MTLWVWFGRLHLNREQNDSLSSRHNRKIRFEAGPQISRGYFLKCSHLAFAAKLHCPKGDRINESLLYTHYTCTYIPFSIHFIGPSADMLLVEYSKAVRVYWVKFPFVRNSRMIPNHLRSKYIVWYT